MPATPEVSVVVATRDRGQRLPKLIEALAAQTEAKLCEVVIVDDASRDDTWERLERLAASSAVRVVPLRMGRNVGPSAARNAGWRAARSSVVAFTDDDCLPKADWLARLVAGLDGADLVQGRTTPDPSQSGRRSPFSHTVEVTGEGYYETCNIAYRRDVLERVGGFDEGFRYPYCEDLDLAWRAKRSGARSGFVCDAIVYHDVSSPSLAGHIRRIRRLDSVPRVIRRHPDLRTRLHRGIYYRPSHPPALMAGVGLAMSCSYRLSRGWRLSALGLLAPYLWDRTRAHPLAATRRTQMVIMPLALMHDLAQVAVLAASSLRYRVLVL
jgi:GT2 family glycosyltransferase